MNLKRLILLLFLISSFDLFSQGGIKLGEDFAGLPFRDFVSKIESQNKIRFYFKDEWINNLKTGDFKGEILLSELLDNMCKGRSLFYFFDSEGNVVITGDYSVKLPGNTTPSNQNFLAPTEYEDQEKQKLSGNAFVDIGNPAEKAKAGSVTISGYITNRDTKEPVAGATIFDQKLSKGILSNNYGFYTLTLPRGSHLIQFSFIGMKIKLINVNLYSSGELNVEMNSTLIPLKETVVSAQKNMVLQRYEAGVEKINIASFRLMPTSMGESDILKSILLIPGVQSVGEGSAGFNVRGGSADQNLILLNGAPVYNSSHFFGFFSAVNSDIIKDVTLYKGGIPGRFGGRISSILDIDTKDGNRKEFAGNAGISPITTHLAVEGPIIKDTLTYIFTGRTTYSNWLMKLIDDPSIKNSRATFYDMNGKLTYDINKNNKLYFAAYVSHDDFKFNSDTLYSYENDIVSVRWRHFFTSNFFSSVSLYNSSYKYDISGNASVKEGFLMSHKINSTGLKADFNWFSGRNEVNYGADILRHTVLPGSFLPNNDSSLVLPKVIQKEKAMEAALYLDDKFVVNEYLSVNAGIRLSSFFVFGPKLLLLYDPDYSKSKSTVTDTLNYKRGDIYKAYGGPEFRASVNLKTSGNSSLKLNYNRTRQYLHLLSNTTSISPTDTWKLSDYYLKPETGDQYALGFYQMLRRNTIEASAEIYYKEIKNMTDFKGSTNLIMNENIERDLVNVRGKAYGIELAVKKSEGRLRWSVGYTYSRTFVQSTSGFADETINNGNWFPANIDRPNDLSVTFNYLFSRRFSFSTNYTYTTGRPITYPLATYYQQDVMLIYYSDRNKYRIPDYSRLDISFVVSGNLRSHKIANPHWIFSVYNLLGKENIYSIYFRNQANTIRGYKLSIFARAIPSVTFNFDF